MGQIKLSFAMRFTLPKNPDEGTRRVCKRLAAAAGYLDRNSSESAGALSTIRADASLLADATRRSPTAPSSAARRGRSGNSVAGRKFIALRGRH